MEQNAIPAGRGGCLLCGAVIPMIEKMWSQATNDHFRNSRVEFLKGIRCLIDFQINQLSKEETKGTHVVIE